MKVWVVLVAFAAYSALGAPTGEDEGVVPAFDPFTDCRLLLSTRENQGSPIVLNFQDLNSINQSPYRSDRPLRISIHGWGASENDGTHHSIARVLLDHGDFNFIFLDWSIGAGSNYITSRNRVGVTGAFLAAYIDWLHENNLVSFDQISIVGFSLGAHVAGFAGKQTTRGRVNTIIGLDPAGPLFGVNSPTERLDAGDAEYVEVIHTNGRANGIGAPIGHADFFPNGGQNQPGCTTGTGCSHTRAVSFYMESIVNNRFRARRCATADDAEVGNCNLDPTVMMAGEPSNFNINLRGIFHLETNSASPFGQD